MCTVETILCLYNGHITLTGQNSWDNQHQNCIEMECQHLHNFMKPLHCSV